jgi:hypothetical protein
MLLYSLLKKYIFVINILKYDKNAALHSMVLLQTNTFIYI